MLEDSLSAWSGGALPTSQHLSTLQGGRGGFGDLGSSQFASVQGGLSSIESCCLLPLFRWLNWPPHSEGTINWGAGGFRAPSRPSQGGRSASPCLGFKVSEQPSLCWRHLSLPFGFSQPYSDCITQVGLHPTLGGVKNPNQVYWGGRLAKESKVSLQPRWQVWASASPSVMSLVQRDTRHAAF
jgi:hypothetical protein